MKFPNLIPSILITMKFEGIGKLRVKIINWVKSHFNLGAYSVINHTGIITFYNKEDALMFSLNVKCADINMQVFDA